uniref:Secreted protein n=1 Tax=Haemonchus placei TaxID=6290 RepID=A0A0N4WXL4_HAEPC
LSLIPSALSRSTSSCIPFKFASTDSSCVGSSGVFGGEGRGVREVRRWARNRSKSMKGRLSCNVSRDRNGGQKRLISPTEISSSAL